MPNQLFNSVWQNRYLDDQAQFVSMANLCNFFDRDIAVDIVFAGRQWQEFAERG
jgi:hypothetical protein